MKTPFALALVGALALAAASASAQTWEYRSFKKNSAGQWDKEKFIPGTVTLDPAGADKGSITIKAGYLDLCHRGALPVAITKTDDTTTLEVLQPVPGCDVFRYVIRNDGSGGVRENRRGDRWVADGFDHGLKPSN